MPWWAVVLIAAALNVVSYLITPHPKGPAPASVEDLENPTASAGMPQPIVFGSVTVKGINVLWYGEKSIHTYEMTA